MDRLDKELVTALFRQPRAELIDVAAETEMVAVQKRLSALQTDGTVAGYTAKVDYERLGYRTVIVRLAVDLGSIDDVTDRLREQPAFVTVYQISGPFTVFAVGRFESEAEIATCLHELHADPDVRTVDTSAVRRIHAENDSPLNGEN